MCVCVCDGKEFVWDYPRWFAQDSGIPSKENELSPGVQASCSLLIHAVSGLFFFFQRILDLRAADFSE